MDVSLPSMQGVAEEEGKFCVDLGSIFVLIIPLSLGSAVCADRTRPTYGRLRHPAPAGRRPRYTHPPPPLALADAAQPRGHPGQPPIPLLHSDLFALTDMLSLQQRNKPKEPPKQPEKAPFFLPTLPGVDQRFAPEQKVAAEQKQKDTHRLKRAAGSAESVFFTKLSEAHESASSDCASLPSACTRRP